MNPGDTIGIYRVVRQIGEGGCGRTYEAHEIRVPTIKACLKQNIPPENPKQKAAIDELLQHEAEIMAKVTHYSLPAYRGLYTAKDGTLVLAMEFIEGKRLDKIIEKHTALHPEEVCWITQRLLNALYYLHTKAIIHGDVKPSNVIVQPTEHNAVLIDYGLSSFRPDRNTRAPGFTPVFTAPETDQGKPPVPQSDLYCLGLTMIYALGGNPITKSYPEYVPKQIQEFCNRLTQYDPLVRPSWEKEDLVAKLSDIRLEVFGRRYMRGKR